MSSLASILRGCEKGDVLEFGHIFNNLTDEPVAWEVIGKGLLDDKGGDALKVILRGHVFETPVAALVAVVRKGSNDVEWRGNK